MRAEPENALTTTELCERIYLSCLPPEKKHRVAVLRAMRTLAATSEEFGVVARQSSGAVVYNRGSLKSRAMAEAKLNAQHLLRRRWWPCEPGDVPERPLATMCYFELSTFDLEEELKPAANAK